jgi:hypothetical protein
MSQLDDFLTQTLAHQLDAEQALINGDPGPRLAMWSTQEPVTVFGAEKSTIGSEEARQAFRWLATRFSNCTDYRFELVAAGASGDLAYTLGYERFSFHGWWPGRADCPASHPCLSPRGRRVEDRPPPCRRPPDRSAPSRWCIDGVGITGRVTSFGRPASCQPITQDPVMHPGGHPSGYGRRWRGGSC